jgi:hypothetical protein
MSIWSPKMTTSPRRGPATLETLTRQLEGLQRHIDSLDQSMQKLASRLVPYYDEWRPISRHWAYPGGVDVQVASIETIFKIAREADAHIEAIERDFAYVRTRIEDLERNDMLADEIRLYLKG